MLMIFGFVTVKGFSVLEAVSALLKTTGSTILHYVSLKHHRSVSFLFSLQYFRFRISSQLQLLTFFPINGIIASVPKQVLSQMGQMKFQMNPSFF